LICDSISKSLWRKEVGGNFRFRKRVNNGKKLSSDVPVFWPTEVATGEFLMGKAKFVIKGGRLQGQSFLIPAGDSLTIGRSIRSDFQIADHSISRSHCEFDHKEDNTVLVTDLDSSNGTIVNREMIKEKLLNPGDMIHIGDHTICFSGLVADDGSGGLSTSVNFLSDRHRPATEVRRKFDRQTSTLAPEEIDRDALTKATKKLASICDFANSLHLRMRPQEICELVSDTMMVVTGAERGAVLLLNNQTSEPDIIAMRLAEHLQDRREFGLSKTIVEETIRQGVSIISSDAASDNRFNTGQSILMQNIHSVMCVPLQAEERVVGAIYVDSTTLAAVFTEKELSMLAAVGRQAGAAIDRSRLVADLENLFVSSMQTIIATIEAKDPYTRGHSERVTSYALMVADEMGLESAERSVVELAGVLHDVGKIGVPEKILLKPGKLNDEEFAEIKKHPEVGACIIENLSEIERIVSMSGIVCAVRHHHERFDGDGYPDGLEGENIPLAARILAVADTFDAITSDRPYRKGRDAKTAADIIQECAGTQFDPAVASLFFDLYRHGITGTPEKIQGRFRFTHAKAKEMRSVS